MAAFLALMAVDLVFLGREERTAGIAITDKSPAIRFKKRNYEN